MMIDDEKEKEKKMSPLTSVVSYIATTSPINVLAEPYPIANDPAAVNDSNRAPWVMA